MSFSENNAKCFFIYFLIFFTALMTCWGIDGIAEFIITYHTNPDFENLWIYRTLRLNISQVLVGFPFLCVAIFVAQRDLKNDTYSVDNAFRRWILFAAMGLSAVFVFYGLVRIFQSFLEGKLALHIMLSFGVLVLIASLAFFYFLIEASKDREKLTSIQWGIAVIATVASISAFGFGLTYNKSKDEVETIRKDREQAKKAKKTAPEPSGSKRRR